MSKADDVWPRQHFTVGEAHEKLQRRRNELHDTDRRQPESARCQREQQKRQHGQWSGEH